MNIMLFHGVRQWIVLGITIASASAASAQLFSNHSASASRMSAGAETDNGFTRTENAELDVAALEGLRSGALPYVSANLFTEGEEVTLTSNATKTVVHSPNSYTIVGYVSEDITSSAAISVVGNTAVGSFALPDTGKNYGFFHDPVSQSLIFEAVPGEEDTGVDEVSVEYEGEVEGGEEGLAEGEGEGAESEGECVENPQPECDFGAEASEPVTVDILFIYPSNKVPGSGNPQAYLQAGVELLNSYHETSNSMVKFNMVHQAAVDDVWVTGNQLGFTSNTTDGTYDEMADTFHSTGKIRLLELRDWVGADMICNIAYTGTAGVAGVPRTEGGLCSFTPFSAVHQNPHTDSFLNIAHETAHNLGCTHNCMQGSTCSTPHLTNYCYGYWFEDGSSNPRRDIMSYECNGLPRLPIFSNPDITYLGGVPGIDPAGAATDCPPWPAFAATYCPATSCTTDPSDHKGADCAKTMRQTVGIIAAKRTRPQKTTVESQTLGRLVEFHETGNCIVYGAIHENVLDTTTERANETGVPDFVVRNTAGEVVARIDGDTGDFYLKGDVLEQDGTGIDALTTPAYKVRHQSPCGDDIAAVIDEDGNLRLRGKILVYDRL